MQYQCNFCKKIIGKTNPKAPSNSQQVNLIQTNHKKFGYYFPYPVGHCRSCGEPYDINKKDLIDEKILDGKQKKALAESISKAEKELAVKKEEKIKSDALKNAKEKELIVKKEEIRIEQEIEDAKNEEIEKNKKEAKADFERSQKVVKSLADEAKEKK